LIELLVVISIIALLSVIVLASLQDARTKAQNSKLNSIAREYVNAFLLLTNGGEEDYPPTTESGDYVCLGYSEELDEPCYYNWYGGDDYINGLLENYYPDMPKNENFIVDIDTNLTASGIIYHCLSNNSDCFIRWYLKGGNQSCILGSVPSNQNTYTVCSYSFN
jgi:type II secretory pathway pseudopilin PulG